MSKKIWITTGVAAALATVYTAGGFWGVPSGIQWAIKKYAEPFTDRKITLDEVKFNPFTLQLTANGLRIQKEGEPQAFMALKSLDTKLNWKSLVKFSPIVDHVTLDGFEANIIRTGLDTFNFSDIINKIAKMPSDKDEDKKKDDDPVRFEIDNVSLINSSITLDDKFRDKVDKFTDINLAVPLISNFKTEVDNPTQPKLQFNFNGEPFSINASSELFVPSLKTGVDFTLRGLNLENAASFNPIPLNAKVTSGTMDAALNLDFAKTVDQQEGYLRLRGTLKILNLSIQDDLDANGYQIANFREININLKEFSLFRQILELGEVQFQEPKFEIIRTAKGINAAELATHILKDAKPEESAGAANSEAVSEEKAPEAKPTAAGKEVKPEAAKSEETKAEPTENNAAAPTETPPETAQTKPAKPEEKAKEALPEKASESSTEMTPQKEAALNMLMRSAHAAESTPEAPTAGAESSKTAETSESGSTGAGAVPTEAPTPNEIEPKSEEAQSDVNHDKPSIADKGPNAQEDPGWKWSVEKASIRGGTVHFSDKTNGFDHDVTNINASVASLNAQPGNKSDIKASLDVLEGSITAEGTLDLTPLDLELNLGTKDLSVPKLSPYIQEFSAAKIAGGKFSSSGKFSLSMNEELKFNYSGEAGLSGAVIHEPNGSQALSVASAEVKGIDVSGLSPINVKIADINIASPNVKVIREKDNSINLMTLAEPGRKPSASAAAVKPAPAKASSSSSAPLSWQIGRISLSGGSVDFTDATNGFHKVISAINASAGPISNNLSAQTAVSANMNIIGGHIGASGNLVISPFKTSLDVTTSALSIADLTPYISQYSGAHVTKGTFSNKGKVTLSTATDPISFSYNGSGDVSNLNVTTAKGEPAASLTKLSASGVSISGLSPLQININSLTASNPSVTIVRAKNGAINLASLADPGGKAAPAAKPAEKPAKKTGKKAKFSSPTADLPAMTISKVVLSAGRVRFTDNSVSPVFNITANKIDGSMTGFSTAKNSKANVDVHGSLNGTPMTLKGTVNPFASNLTVAMQGSVQSLSLPTFSPFSAEFTGYPIVRGQITYNGSLDVHKDEVKSENNMVINKLEFGNEIPNAKNTMPVGLAVSLLQDRSGQIDLNIPVSGSLNDPEFSIGGIIVKVIANLITKAVTAPFALIGSMFGGGDADLHNLAFDAGTAKLSPKTVDALKVVAKAMSERPGIKIQIMGIADDKQDTQGLKESLLMRSMRYAIYRDSTAATDMKQLTPVQISQAIKALYSESEIPDKPKLTDVQQMHQFLLEHQRVATADYVSLAQRRADAVRNYLINVEKINPDRLFIVSPQDQKGDTKVPGVALGLQN